MHLVDEQHREALRLARDDWERATFAVALARYHLALEEPAEAARLLRGTLEAHAFASEERVQLSSWCVRAELSGEVADLGDATEELVFEDDPDVLDEAGMATQEIANVETLIDEESEDVGEIELEEEEPVAAAPVRRTSSPRAVGGGAMEEEATEPMGILAVAILTALVMILALPLIFSVSSGETSGMAEGIASIFFGDAFK